MRCKACVAGVHEECSNSIVSAVDSADGPMPLVDCCCWSEGAISLDEPKVTVLGAPTKNPEDMKDPVSTGRKRAAQLKPIIEDMICDWAGLLNAGGGITPIVGCTGVKLTKEKGNEVRTGNIHHGPDKDVLNNSDENLHRVCSRCHNRWHALNDPAYPKSRPTPGTPFVPVDAEIVAHDKYTKATEEQLAFSEAWWAIKPASKRTGTFRKEDNV